MRDLPRGSTVTVLDEVSLVGVDRQARLIEVEYPRGTTQRRVQIAGGDGFGEVAE